MTLPADLIVRTHLDPELHEAAWDAYADAFEELRSAAIQRHVMTRTEFDLVMGDERVQKFVVRRRTGQVAALATLANDLASMPLVSPEFFAARWPEHYEAGRCWYIGFVAVRPREQGSGAFVDIVGTVAATLGPHGGVLVLDVPQRNTDRFHVPNAVKRIADAVVPGVTMEQVDTQGYWAYTTPMPQLPDPVDLRDPVPDQVDLRDETVSGSVPPATRD